MNQIIKKYVKLFGRVLEEVPELTYVGNPILRAHTMPVSVEDGLSSAKRLEQVLIKYREITGVGRGLAAPQIGESKAVFITYIGDTVETYINPKIIKKSNSKNFYKELCMSTGLVAADVERPEWIVLEWTDADGKKHEKKFDGFQARLLQHEEAHLRGHINLDDAASEGVELITFDPLKEQLRTVR